MTKTRLKKLRNERLYTLQELANLVGTTASTVQRYENNLIKRRDPDLITKFAEALDTSAAYLLGMTDEMSPDFNFNVGDYVAEDNPNNILVTDDEMSPEIPQGAIVKIRPIEANEKLQIGSFYYIEFNNKKCFRMIIEDEMNGVGFLPNEMSERRIAYDLDYVTIIGKAILMKVYFEDDVEYE